MLVHSCLFYPAQHAHYDMSS